MSSTDANATRPRVLFVYFTYTQQSLKVVEAMAEVLRDRGCDVQSAAIELTDSRYAERFTRFPLRHVYRDLFGMTPAQMRGATGEIRTPDEASDGDYDLVVIGSPTWWLRTERAGSLLLEVRSGGPDPQRHALRRVCGLPAVLGLQPQDGSKVFPADIPQEGANLPSQYMANVSTVGQDKDPSPWGTYDQGSDGVEILDSLARNRRDTNSCATGATTTEGCQRTGLPGRDLGLRIFPGDPGFEQVYPSGFGLGVIGNVNRRASR